LSAVIGFAVKVAWLDHTLQTQASEWRSVPLSDGSSISAMPYTRLRHTISDEQRLITLAQGSAMFRVAKDPSRPFLVDAGVVVVKATGTQFTVGRHGDRVKVIVREGSVIVSPQPGAGASFAAVPLAADEQLTISGSGAPAVAAVDAEKSSEQARGLLTFQPGDTVKDAVAQFNEYNAIKIVVDDVTAARQMRGSFDAIDVLSFVASVKETTGADIVHEEPKLVRIGQRDAHTR